MRIPFAKVDCSGNESKYVLEVLESGWLTTAGKCAAFEKRFAEEVGATYACAVNSATAALHLAAEAVGIGPGDKVFVPTMTFTASAEVIRYLGADPILLDVEYGSCLLTPDLLDAAAERHPDARAAVVVHFGGQACDMDGILDVCRRRGLKLIEDAAHAFPARYKDRLIGSFGDATCFSFYANKTITTGEGGMLVTEDEGVFKRAKTMRLHGINRDIWDRFTARKASWEYDVVAPGFKYNLPDVAAAIGLAQLERAKAFREGRERCARHYFGALSDLACLQLPVVHCRMDEHAWHLFPIILREGSRIDRNVFIERMNEKGIGLSVHYKPLHRMTYYRERYGLPPEDFPNAERIWQGTVSLPIYPALTEDELAYICRSVREILE
jgi:dTDP-4-amino-4,6-dideoxygalactose transaminase